ncbi:hypothetical protein DEU56DRAFT_758682 [Suillus clintonianus]|uniref:uncharacterized protein n=1 Tax=Suillus clintonianus TaxID=1904413 RepID=UPI001B864872|nr:uncharacterized protein DEU56DRAFT_758682 [Suillus clintonianus]KAG2127245.1 hypothetical protein DEU56DRAFT_758682 [Suillus clintonianus]
MSAPSSPHSESSALTEFEFVVDPNVVKMLVKILTCCHGILHYHPQTRELTMFQWPTNRYGQKIHPSRFEAYREAHRYVEASVFQRTAGICQGEYMAECATSTCGYMLNIEKYFGRACVPAVYYPRREVANRAERYRRMRTNPYGSIGCIAALGEMQ